MIIIKSLKLKIKNVHMYYKQGRTYVCTHANSYADAKVLECSGAQIFVTILKLK